mmetsp:Transcript_46256/g.75476  ORF Transcript_46256/g.75476 Transcript_46256/m.75476 type:complete len:203 (+) Transcript_46256:297-905(+)
MDLCEEAVSGRSLFFDRALSRGHSLLLLGLGLEPETEEPESEEPKPDSPTVSGRDKTITSSGFITFGGRVIEPTITRSIGFGMVDLGSSSNEPSLRASSSCSPVGVPGNPAFSGPAPPPDLRGVNDDEADVSLRCDPSGGVPDKRANATRLAERAGMMVVESVMGSLRRSSGGGRERGAVVADPPTVEPGARWSSSAGSLFK